MAGMGHEDGTIRHHPTLADRAVLMASTLTVVADLATDHKSCKRGQVLAAGDACDGEQGRVSAAYGDGAG